MSGERKYGVPVEQLRELDGGRATPGDQVWTPAHDEQTAAWAEDDNLPARRGGDLDTVLDDLPEGLGDQWRDDPAGAGYRVATVRDALSVIGELESYDSDALVRSFEGWLSEPVQTAILSELGQGTPGRTRTPDEETVRAFTSTEEGEILRRHWRSRTERNLGRVLYRLQNIRDSLSPQGNRQLDDWINKLNERQMVAAMIALAGD